VVYRVVLGVLFILAVLLTLNERFQERRSQEMAAGGGPPAVGSGDAYPVAGRGEPTATPFAVTPILRPYPLTGDTAPTPLPVTPPAYPAP